MEAGRITPGRYAWLLARGEKRYQDFLVSLGFPPDQKFYGRKISRPCGTAGGFKDISGTTKNPAQTAGKRGTKPVTSGMPTKEIGKEPYK